MDPLRPGPRCRCHCCSGRLCCAGPAAGAAAGQGGPGSTAQVGARGGGAAPHWVNPAGLPVWARVLPRAQEGALLWGQPLLAAPAFRCSVSARVTVTVTPRVLQGGSDAMDSGMWGRSCACSPHRAKHSVPELRGQLCVSLWHKRCPRLCWRQTGSGEERRGEGEPRSSPGKSLLALDFSVL